ncbi:Chromosome (plasmid) partitioning protein ParB / Stage 0 sporulation protein J [Sphingobium indicum BiD32]|uniref:Chromosome (Plasmid) partitioning protein ParB / Stage 0 sporulation protein J n=1 Tax=Sphingobium indicum BiD32 TaxID=1301087 RepID=N1MKA1_9SPHN|nr:PRTRC system ParB family protein [Sphingobium indicum]CCW17386.1 Chromosome (plasmid) partitioning protein ParB / Stage 0 sporulation protein J [Sphingobium indicum BiD32]
MDAPEPVPEITLPLSKIIKGDNPRRYFDRAKHEELVASIRRRGVLQPILLRPKDGFFAIVAGERRYRASLEVYGPEGEIPVVIREMTDQEALEAAIAENHDRDNASETEQADAAVRVLAACQGDRAEAAKRLGWSRTMFDRRLALAELSEPVKTALDERRIKVGHAELLAAVPKDKQDKALETILTAQLDVAKTQELLKRVTQDLASACFDKSECTRCPYNSATQRALFETHVEDGYCTNAGCFQIKTEAAEVIRFEKEAQAEAAARAALATSADDEGADTADTELDTAPPAASQDGEGGGEPPSVQSEANPSSAPAPVSPAKASQSAPKPGVTAKSLAARTKELREATWRTALARALAGNVDHARTTILVAAMSGSLSQIKAETLTSRASLLVGDNFRDLDYANRIAEIQVLPDARSANILSVIGAAYAKDVLNFSHVADLARVFGVDLRDSWQVDQAFLERYTKDELSFIAQECGLVAHIGAKSFARLLASKKTELITGMLNRIGFDWAGRLPGAMTLDSTYGPPPDPTPVPDEAPARVAELVA